MRSMPTARWMGPSATSICMVEQFGLAMMPRGRWRNAPGLTSATTSGTSSSRRKAEEWSITTAPAAANFGAYCRDTSPPAENRAKSTPEGSNVARSRTSTSSLPNATSPPAERSLARATSSETGNLRSASTDNMVSPTAPVAPTTATLNCFISGNPREYFADVAALRAMAQGLVHQHQRQHRFADGHRADAD